MKSGSISVAYLCWLPYGIKCFTDFIDSYKNFDAGVSHDLLVIFKGSELQTDITPYITILHTNRIPFQQLNYTGDGLDISTYYWAAQQFHSENVIFLNSRSRILANNWLYHFYTSSIANPKTVFSATGSWQSYVSSIFSNKKFGYENTKSFKENINKYKLFFKTATLWWYYFSLFPNPHIRTNAFFINRELFLSLKIKAVITKINAYRFESGRNSFTKQLKRKGYTVALLSKDGKQYCEREWNASKIFWTANQENLMIADNQTDIYKNSDFENKRLLEKLAWNNKAIQ